MRIPRIPLAVLFALTIVALGAATAQACPTCGSGMSEAGEAGRKMINGWFWSIIFMMSMPFAILSSLGGYMYYLVRKARRAGEGACDALASAGGNEAAFASTMPRGERADAIPS